MRVIAFVVGFMALSTSSVWSCADGPDHYRIHGVASNDSLNVRSGPGLGFSVIGELPYNAEGVQSLDQVPVHLCDGNVPLNSFEKSNRWSKISWSSSERDIFGWVKSRFLRE